MRTTVRDLATRESDIPVGVNRKAEGLADDLLFKTEPCEFRHK